MRLENDEDRRALITGLSLHEKGRTSLQQVNVAYPTVRKMLILCQITVQITCPAK